MTESNKTIDEDSQEQLRRHVSGNPPSQPPDDSPVLDMLDALPRMDLAAGRGIREIESVERNVYEMPGDGEEPVLVVIALLVGDEGTIIVTDRYEREDFAWSSDTHGLTLLDELVEQGHLVRTRTDVEPFDA
jgi:hypothetical protein